MLTLKQNTMEFENIISCYINCKIMWISMPMEDWVLLGLGIILIIIAASVPALLTSVIFYAIDGGFNKKPNQIFWAWTSFSDYFYTHLCVWGILVVIGGSITVAILEL